ncbi:MAG: MATE family efflux transporter [Candidatus Bipolaricaulota bacterium]
MLNIKKLFRSKKDINLTSGSLIKPLFFLSLPVIITNLLRTAYSLADTFWVGRLSKEALAAITFSYPIVFLFIALGMGVAVAGSVLVAQHEGAGDRKEVEYAASQTILFSFAVAILLGVGGYFLVKPVLQLLGASPDVIPMATGYLRIVTLGLFALFGFSVFIALMRGFGETLTPMLVMLFSVVLNIFIDPFLIFGWFWFPRMGIQGAAIATVFCRGLGLLVGLWILFTGRKGLQIHLSYMKPDFRLFRKIFGIGIPASIEGTGRAVSVNALLSVVGGFATSVVAGYGIGIRVFSTVFLPALAVSRSVETMTGQNIGAQRFDRAERANYVAALGMFLAMTLLGVAIFFLSPFIVSIFTNNEQVISVGAEFLKYISLTFGFVGSARVFSGGFRGAGKTMVAAGIAVLILGVIRYPSALFLSGRLGRTGIWWAFVISNVAALFIAYSWFKQGTWKRKIIKEEAEKGEVAEELSTIEETITE